MVSQFLPFYPNNHFAASKLSEQATCPHMFKQAFEIAYIHITERACLT